MSGGLALLFPGQGAQHVGMGRSLAGSFPEARAIFEEADDVLGLSLSTLMWEGPEDELVLTHNAQPAILTHSVAAFAVGRDRVGEPAFSAGHSLGEFSAHVAAGTLSFRAALEVVRLRGDLMTRAGAERPGTMAAILGLDDVTVEEVCSTVTSGVCVPANFNSPGQVVVSGDQRGVAEAIELAKEAGAKRALPLSVSGAFHSPLMESAESGLRDGLAPLALADPAFPVMSNVTGKPVVSAEEARDLLVRQLTSPVRWTDCVTSMVEGGARRFVEFGPGSVLCGLNRRNARDVPCTSVGTPDDVTGLDVSEPEANPRKRREA